VAFADFVDSRTARLERGMAGREKNTAMNGEIGWWVKFANFRRNPQKCAGSGAIRE